MDIKQAKVILSVAGFNVIKQVHDGIIASRDLPGSDVRVIVSTIPSKQWADKILWASICSYDAETARSATSHEPIRRVRLDDPTFETVVLEALKAVAHDYSELALSA